eukprot:scaffold1106_cov126-Cylindrotheca_fusiformis.AAC.10
MDSHLPQDNERRRIATFQSTEQSDQIGAAQDSSVESERFIAGSGGLNGGFLPTRTPVMMRAFASLISMTQNLWACQSVIRAGKWCSSLSVLANAVDLSSYDHKGSALACAEST